jgi:hypothetical protein
MTGAADLVFTNAAVHSLVDPDPASDADGSPDAEAVAVRDGRIVGVGSAYDVAFRAGVETEVVDLDGRTLLPGFVDAHTHMTTLGRRLVHADLGGASGPDDAVARLRERARETAGASGSDGAEADGDSNAGGWVLGFGYDESAWDEARYLDRADLDAVSETRPVAAFREDMHVASVNSVALDRHVGEMPDDDVRREGGRPTGVIVEEAVDVVYRAIEPGVAETRELLRAAQTYANERGVTGVHDMVRRSHAPRVYRELALADELTLRVRLNYWSDHLDALVETGLRTNAGGEMVRTGAVKTYTDGSFGGRTAKLSRAYEDWPADGTAGAEASGDGAETDAGTGDGRDATADGGEEGADPTGTWVVPPAALRDLVARADGEGFQVSAHAIGDVAVDETLGALASREDPGGMRHRVEHAELASDEAIERFAETGVVASMQPNFHRWAGEDGLYATRLGDRRTETNRLRRLVDAGVDVAFGSDCMPLDPLLGVDHAVTAPTPAQRLTVTEALRAYTHGAAYAGFDEDRLGTVEVGKRADLVALEESPWDADSVRDVDVAMTVVDGDVVHDAR